MLCCQFLHYAICVFIYFINLFSFVISCLIWRFPIRGFRLKEMDVAMLFVFSGEPLVKDYIPPYSIYTFQLWTSVLSDMPVFFRFCWLSYFTTSSSVPHLSGCRLLKVWVRRRGRLWIALCWTAPSDCRAEIIVRGWQSWSLPTAPSTAPQIKNRVRLNYSLLAFSTGLGLMGVNTY